MIDGIYIPDIIREVVTNTQNVEVIVDGVTKTMLRYVTDLETEVIGDDSNIQKFNFQFGHYNELIETLIQYDKSQEERFNKYPLIWLRTDFRERRGQQIGIYAEVFLNIIICHASQQTIKSTERLENVFKPVLYPIYYEFLNQLYLHPMVQAYDGSLMSHDKYDRYYWGANQLGKTTDYVDAIDIDNLSLNILFNNCYNTQI